MLIVVLANILDRLIDINVKSGRFSQGITKFHSSFAPNVSILSYLERIQKYANCSDACLIVALIYIDRLIEARKFTICSLNIHRLLITCVMVVIKFFEDEFFKNSFYAKLGGIPSWEINYLEIELLQLLNFNLFVDHTLFDKYYSELSVNIRQLCVPRALSPMHDANAIALNAHAAYANATARSVNFVNTGGNFFFNNDGTIGNTQVDTRRPEQTWALGRKRGDSVFDFNGLNANAKANNSQLRAKTPQLPVPIPRVPTAGIAQNNRFLEAQVQVDGFNNSVSTSSLIPVSVVYLQHQHKNWFPSNYHVYSTAIGYR